MEENKRNRAFEPLELMLKWNHYCDASGREGDSILLNDEQTYREAFNGVEQAMKEILNSQEPRFIRGEGFLVPVWDDGGRYRGMRYVSEDDIGKWIDLDLMGLD